MFTNNINSSNVNMNKSMDVKNPKTPSVSGKTPLRDGLNINLGEDINSWENSSVNNNDGFSVASSGFGKMPNISQLLSNLPQPKNKYEIDIIDDNTLESMKLEDELPDTEMTIEDEDDKKRRMEYEREEEERKKFKNETMVIQRKLMRPIEINKNFRSYLGTKLDSIYSDEIDDLDYRKNAEELVKEEINKLVEFDFINHPEKGAKVIIYHNKNLIFI